MTLTAKKFALSLISKLYLDKANLLFPLKFSNVKTLLDNLFLVFYNVGEVCGITKLLFVRKCESEPCERIFVGGFRGSSELNF